MQIDRRVAGAIATLVRYARHSRRLLSPAAFLAVAATALTMAVWLLPEVLTRTNRTISAKDLLDAKNNVRVTLLQAIAGIVLAIGLYFTSRTLKLNHEGQITERYAKAIELLGNEAIDVRVGGVFALERLARDSQADSDTICAVLIAFVSERTSEPGRYGRVPLEDPINADVQAALTVLGRWHSPIPDGIRLQGCGFNQAKLFGSSWPRAQFNYCKLNGAGFSEADLTNAGFSWTQVTAGGFLRVEGSGTHFVRSRVQAWFCGADLSGADFAYADLRGADFGERRDGDPIEGRLTIPAANLDGADFTNADLEGTIFCGTDLSNALGISRGQFARAITNARTVPPKQWAPDPVSVGPDADVVPWDANADGDSENMHRSG
ncbi:pentapeptide repeat-containing protein [Micromonospora cremea]|uniref:Pentapeptide repeat-containing protein n=1 Tax=Micromonospora cremea TaxID=709881 RepID=A0A1N5V4Q8_9ACTN|nr:pentapeptide repeat-containing protein [Micromonospora cremea]SIM67890.1 Pentapeptide repeat-containing protein [Micromonospora cremea]